MKPKVKICGVTNLIDAKNALNLGAHYIGFVNIEGSLRFVSLSEIVEVAKGLSNEERLRSVLLTVEDSADNLIKQLAELGFKTVQIYGNLSKSDLSKLKLLSYRIIKPFQIENEDSLGEMKEFRDLADVILLDSKSKNPFQMGGTGHSFDWQIFLKAKKLLGETNLALAGGLNPENIQEALNIANPYMVDVSSGLESRPGIKSLEKMKDFFDKIKLVDQLV